MFARIVLFSLSSILLTTLVGCSQNKVTRQNFDMIVEGSSTRLEVEHTLGDAYADRGGSWEYDEEDRHLSVVVYFDGKGIVTRKEWIDAKAGAWDGAAPGIDESPEGKKVSDPSSTTTLKKE